MARLKEVMTLAAAVLIICVAALAWERTERNQHDPYEFLSRIQGVRGEMIVAQKALEAGNTAEALSRIRRARERCRSILQLATRELGCEPEGSLCLIEVPGPTPPEGQP